MHISIERRYLVSGGAWERSTRELDVLMITNLCRTSWDLQFIQTVGCPYGLYNCRNRSRCLFRHHFGVYGMTHVVASGAPTEQRFPPDLCLVNYREVSEQRWNFIPDECLFWVMRCDTLRTGTPAAICYQIQVRNTMHSWLCSEHLLELELST